MKLRIGISPCPNDTFIFDAIYSKQIDISPFEFEFIFEDVETLNQLALESKLDIIKLSYANYFNVLDNYIMLRSGGALGNKVGPILVSKKNYHLTDIDSLTVAIPGINTTANFLLTYAFPFLTKKTAFVFSDIIDAVLENKVDAGVIIHENRFTYQTKGLHKLIDLGEYWELKTNKPIPLGGIAIKRIIDPIISKKINNLIQESILFSRAQYPILSDFVTCHAQEMDADVMRNHIELYVNQYSIEIGEKGMLAVQKMSDILGNHSNSQLFIY